MVNIDRIKNLAKAKGVSIAFICKQFDVGRGYLNDVAVGKNRISDERIRKIADILGTTYEYLTDQTEDPNPKTADIIASADSADEKVVLMLIARLPELSGDDIDILEALLSLPKQEFSRYIEILRMMMKQ